MTTSRAPSLALAVALLLGLGPADPVAPPAGPPVAAGPDRTVTIHGRAGSFGSLGPHLPSGQPLATRAVPGWGLPAGSQAGAATVAADGTVFLAGRDQRGGTGPPTGRSLAIGAYQPATGGYTTIRVPTSTGRYEVADPAGGPLAPPVTDLAPLAGGEAVAFTAGASYPGHDLATDGAWPVLGILTKVDGVWQVAGGGGWANRWTGGELRASAPVLSERACPQLPGEPEHSDCRGLGELVGLPHSGHLIATQAGVPGWHNGALLALRLAGPGPAGRFTVTVTGFYLYPNVRDPETGELLDLALRGLQADPTGGADGERFVVALPDAGDPDRPVVIQEFRYHAATGTIAPVSAPTIPGDQAGEDGPFYGYATAAYDRDGNLWAARHRGLAGGKLAIHLGGLGCGYDPARAAEDYRTTAGGRTVWGQACPPDLDLLQAQELTVVVSLMWHPAGRELVALTVTGTLLPVRVSGTGSAIRFQVGNLVDTGLRLLPAIPGGFLTHPPGALDPTGRLWLPAAQAPADGAAAPAPVDQWLYAVAVADLFDPPPVPLPEVPGQVATVQAGHTVTTGTLPRDGSWAGTDINSEAYLRPCGEGTSSVGCSYDGLPGDGFLLGHHSGFGHLDGEVAYRVEVPAAGQYRVAYRVLTFEVTTDAEIVLSAAGRSYRTPVDTAGRWLTVPVADPVALPAGGQTIRLAPPAGGGGWYLSWFTLQRG